MIGRIITGIGALFGGALSSQFPEFYQQYLQRLGGRRDQAMARAEEIVMDAESHGLGVADYIQRFLDSEQHALEGRRMLESFEDAARLGEALEALTGAAPWQHASRFAQYFDHSIAEATFAIFTPALPLTLEGLSYAVAGGLTAASLITGGKKSLHGLKARILDT